MSGTPKDSSSSCWLVPLVIYSTMWCIILGKHTGLYSRLLQLTAFIIFFYSLYTLWLYHYFPQVPLEWMLYGILTSSTIAVGVLAFDDVFKPQDDFVGWRFLAGFGMLSLLIGVFFIFFPTFDPLSNAFFIIRTRAFAHLIFGVILLIESLLIRGDIGPGDHDVNSDTIGPLLLKFLSIFIIAWGVYHISEYIVPYLDGFPLTTNWQLLLSGLTSVLVGLVLVIYVERQKRQPRFRNRRLPLLMSFLLLLATLPLTTIFLALPHTFVLPISLGLSVSLVLISFYIVYHPTMSR